jgi:hypothetical protein
MTFKRSPYRKAVGANTAPQKSLGEVFLQNWVPPLLSGVIAVSGGFLAARLTEESTQKKIYLELKSKHADELARHLASYSANWARMLVTCSIRDSEIREAATQNARGSRSREQKMRDKETLQRRNAGLLALSAERNRARDGLFGAFGSIRLYYGDKVIAQIASFENWDQEQSIKECHQLPHPNEWSNRSKAILDAIRAEIEPK